MKQFAITMFLLTAGAGLALGACGPQTSALSISMSEYEFDPTIWEVPAGAQVELTLTNEGMLFHNWVLMPPEEEVEPPYSVEEQRQALADFRVRGGAKPKPSPSPPQASPANILCSAPRGGISSLA